MNESVVLLELNSIIMSQLCLGQTKKLSEENLRYVAKL